MYNLSTAADVAAFVRYAESNLRAREAREAHAAHRSVCVLVATIFGVPAVAVLCGYLGTILSLPGSVGVNAVVEPYLGGFIGAVAGIVIGLGVGWSVGLIISDGVVYWLNAMKGRNKIYAVVLFVLASVAVFGFFANLGVIVSAACMVLCIFWFSQGGEGKFVDLFVTVVLMIITVAVLQWALPKLAAGMVKNAEANTESTTEAK